MTPTQKILIFLTVLAVNMILVCGAIYTYNNFR